MLRSAIQKIPRAALCGFACCVLASAVAHADVYKYKDEKGNVLYTDKPQFLPAERLSIKSDNSNIVDLDQNKEEDTAQRDAARKETQQSASEKKKSNQSMATGKAELCNKARQDYLARMNAQRVYEEGPKGEKRLLSEKEVEAARHSAKQAMDAICN